MPEYVRSFSNPSGSLRATGLDQLAEQRAGRQSSEALQREMLNAQIAESAANRGQELNIQGSFQDRGNLQDRMLQAQLAAARSQQELANQGNATVAAIGNQPAMGRLGLEQTQYRDSRSDTAPQRDLANAYATGELGLVRRLFDSHGQPAGAPVAGDPGIPGAFQRGIGGGQPVGSGGPANGDDALLKQLMQLKNPGAYFDSERRAQDRAEAHDSQDTQVFSTMAASPDPRVRALGIAGLQKTRAFGQLPAGTVQGLSKPLASTGEDFLAKPEVQSEVAAIGQQLAAAGNDTNAEQLALALKPRLDRLVSRAAETGADPNQVLQALLQKLGEAAPASTLFSNPITNTLGAIPGVRNLVPTPSRDVARRAIGIE